MTRHKSVYKLTDSDGYTRRGRYNETLWGKGVRHEATGTGGLCSPGVIHQYNSPELASFFNPIHANIEHPICWEAEAGRTVEHDGTKGGSRWLRTLRKVPLPTLTTEQRVEIAIRVALWHRSSLPSGYITWAERWLAGEDRSAEAARAAEAAAARAEERAAAWAAGAAEAWAAEEAAGAAEEAWAEAAEAWAAAEAERAAAMAPDKRAFAKRLTNLIREVLADKESERTVGRQKENA